MLRLKVISLLFVLTALTVFACSSDQEKKQSHFEKGNAYYEKGEYKSAKLEYKNAIQIDSKYIQAYQKLGETNLKLGDAQGAFRAFSIVADLDPENIDAQLKLATFLMLAKQYDSAGLKVDLVLNQDPNICVLRSGL